MSLKTNHEALKLLRGRLENLTGPKILSDCDLDLKEASESETPQFQWGMLVNLFHPLPTCWV